MVPETVANKTSENKDFSKHKRKPKPENCSVEPTVCFCSINTVFAVSVSNMHLNHFDS